MVHTLHIGLSYDCNLSCRHCFVDPSDDRLTVNDCLNIIDSLLPEGLFVVVYTYGEPLLWPDFFDLVREVKKRNLVQVLMTNGTLIDIETAKKIKEYHINSVCVSIDSSDEQKHDENRRVKGTFKKALNGIKLLKDLGVNVGFATTVTKNNCCELNDIYNLALKYHVDSISFLRERNNNKISDIYEDEYIEFFLNHIQKSENTITFHDPFLNIIINKIYEDKRISLEKKQLLLDMNSCKNKYTICVHPNGEISKCNFVKVMDKNYFDVSFKEYIKTEEFKNENSVCYS